MGIVRHCGEQAWKVLRFVAFVYICLASVVFSVAFCGDMTDDDLHDDDEGDGYITFDDLYDDDEGDG